MEDTSNTAKTAKKADVVLMKHTAVQGSQAITIILTGLLIEKPAMESQLMVLCEKRECNEAILSILR